MTRLFSVKEGNCAKSVSRASKSKIHFRNRHFWPTRFTNHQPYDCLLNRIFKRRSKKTSKLRVTGLGEFPAQRASNAENVSIWWRHHDSSLIFRPAFFGFFQYAFPTSMEIEWPSKQIFRQTLFAIFDDVMDNAGPVLEHWRACNWIWNFYHHNDTLFFCYNKSK